MKSLKKLTVALLLTGACQWASADDAVYRYLVFHQTDGTDTAMDIDGLTVTYQDGVMTVTNATTTRTFASDKLESMWFSNNTTAIGGINTDEADTAVDIYTVDGLFCGKYDSPAAASAQLPKGKIYIARTKSTTFKIYVK